MLIWAPSYLNPWEDAPVAAAQAFLCYQQGSLLYWSWRVMGKKTTRGLTILSSFFLFLPLLFNIFNGINLLLRKYVNSEERRFCWLVKSSCMKRKERKQRIKLERGFRIQIFHLEGNPGSNWSSAFMQLLMLCLEALSSEPDPERFPWGPYGSCAEHITGLSAQCFFKRTSLDSHPQRWYICSSNHNIPWDRDQGVSPCFKGV